MNIPMYNGKLYIRVNIANLCAYNNISVGDEVEQRIVINLCINVKTQLKKKRRRELLFDGINGFLL